MLELITTLLRALSSVAADPGLGARGAAIKAVLDLAAFAIERGTEGADQLKALVADLQAMVAEGRDPTPEEWSALKLRSDAAHAAIQNWRPE